MNISTVEEAMSTLNSELLRAERTRPQTQKLKSKISSLRRRKKYLLSLQHQEVDLGPEFPESIEQFTQTTIEIPADGVSYNDSDTLKFETSQRFERG